MTLASGCYYVIKILLLLVRSEKGRLWQDQECRERKNNIQEITLELNYITTEERTEKKRSEEITSHDNKTVDIKFRLK